MGAEGIGKMFRTERALANPQFNPLNYLCVDSTVVIPLNCVNCINTSIKNLKLQSRTLKIKYIPYMLYLLSTEDDGAQTLLSL